VKFVKLPDGDWINLSLATQVSTIPDEDDFIIAVSWVATARMTYLKGENAIALLKGIEENSA